MREIKFRAWAFCSRCMFYPNWELENGELKAIPNTALMQYTGLKNIWESDIIVDNLGIGVIEYCNKYAGFRVNYKNGKCKWFYDYLDSEMKTVEVIGNIFENPELLKETNEQQI